MGGEDGQKRLEGIVEDDLVVLPGMNWSQLHSQLERGRNGTLALQPRVEFEMVVKGHLFLSRFWDEMYLYVNLELSPPGFRNLERWFIDVSNGVWIRIVQLKRHAFNEITQVVGTPDDIRVWAGSRATYGDGPFVRVARGSRLLIGKKAGRVPVDNRTVYA